MPHPPPLILGYSQAAMFLRRLPPPEVAGLISIHGRREFGVECVPTSGARPQHPPRLDLAFDDVEVPAPDDLLSLLRATTRRRWAEQNGLAEVAPTASAAAAIIAFARSLAERPTPGVLLCHCGAGMSRAPAAALICLATWNGPGTENDCVQHIRRLRAGASPHLGLVRFADELLSRGGKLAAAVQQLPNN